MRVWALSCSVQPRGASPSTTPRAAASASAAAVAAAAWQSAHHVTAHAASSGAAAVLRGHSGGANCIALLPDGLHAVSGGDDGSIRMYSAGAGAAAAACGFGEICEGSPIRALAVCCRGAQRAAPLLVSAGDDCCVRLHALPTARDPAWRWSLRVLDGHTDSILCACVIDGAVLSGSVDRTIRVWRLDGADAETDAHAASAWEDAEDVVVIGPLADAIASVSVVRNVLVYGDVNGGLYGVY